MDLFLPCRHALAEPLDAAAADVGLLLARVDRMAHPAHFHRLLFDRTRDHEDGPAGAAGGLGVHVDRWVRIRLHSRSRVQEIVRLPNIYQ